MPIDTSVANGDPPLAGLPKGVTVAQVVQLFLEAHPVNGEQLLRARLSALGAAHPDDLPAAKLPGFIQDTLRALKSAGVRDPAGVLAYGLQLKAEAAAATLGSSAKIGSIAAQPKSADRTPVKIENNSSTISVGSPQPVAQTIAYGTTKAEDERQPDKPAMNTAPQTIGNPEATSPATAAGDEIVIRDRRLLGERRVAEMLGRSLRTLQRWRKEGKSPPSTNIGREVFYELNDLQEWIDRGKTR